MYFIKTPWIYQKAFPNLRWCYPENNKIYLTFDDGPNPESTPRLLDLLEELNVKASFFCLGQGVKNFPDLHESILKSGHLLAHHGYNHISGWKTGTDPYILNVEKSTELFSSKFFRPPYGKLKPSQLRKLKKDFEIIMWNVMPGDFDNKINKETLYKNLDKHTTDGSIIVLHDQPHALGKLEYALPKFVEKSRSLGREFGLIH